MELKRSCFQQTHFLDSTELNKADNCNFLLHYKLNQAFGNFIKTDKEIKHYFSSFSHFANDQAKDQTECDQSQYIHSWDFFTHNSELSSDILKWERNTSCKTM